MSDPSDNFSGTTVISGIQFAGTGRAPLERSTSSPPKRAVLKKTNQTNQYLFNLSSRNFLLWL